MNIEKIELNILYKSYKSVCEVLEEKVKTGNSKKSQVEEWNRYFKINREGNGFIFIEKYEVAIAKVNNMIGKCGKSKGSRNNSNLYGKYIEKLVLDILVQKYRIDKETKIYSSRDKMLRSLNIINDNYSFGKFNRGILGDFIEADNENVKEFYQLNNRNLYETVERAFKALANKCLVNWEIVTTVAIDVKDEDRVIIGYDNKPIKMTEEHRTMNEEERDIIFEAERKVFVEMGIEDKKDAFLHDRYKEFNDKVCKILVETSNIMYYYKSYDILFHKDVTRELTKINTYLLEQEKRQQIKITLNGIISDSMIINCKKRHDKALVEKKEHIGDWTSRKEQYLEVKLNRRIDDNYIEDNQKIIDNVINFNTPDQIKKMLKSSKDAEDLIDKELDEKLNEIFPLQAK